MRGISFNGKHSWKDFRLTLAPGREVGRPSKEKVKHKPAFSNVEYDFSTLYGSQVYSNRELKYSFNLIGNTKEDMSFQAVKIINWLMNSNGKTKLIDDSFPGYYFLAEVESEASFKENYTDGILTVTFDAYPFMISELPEGHDIWDDFNFILDYAQTTSFSINGETNIELFNPSATVLRPVITTDAPMTIETGLKSFSVNAGITQSYDFMLEVGFNELKITGNGNIDFKMYKELI